MDSLALVSVVGQPIVPFLRVVELVYDNLFSAIQSRKNKTYEDWNVDRAEGIFGHAGRV